MNARFCLLKLKTLRNILRGEPQVARFTRDLSRDLRQTRRWQGEKLNYRLLNAFLWTQGRVTKFLVCIENFFLESRKFIT